MDFIGKSAAEIDTIESLGFRNLPVCIAKTQYSLSDDAKKLGRPSGFRISIRSAKVSAGAGFVVALAGDIMTMPVCRRFRLRRISTWTVPERSADYFNRSGNLKERNDYA